MLYSHPVMAASKQSPCQWGTILDTGTRFTPLVFRHRGLQPAAAPRGRVGSRHASFGRGGQAAISINGLGARRPTACVGRQ